MEKESNVLLDQLKAEHGHQVEALEERHQHELEEAVLRVNRDLMAAHAEEITKIQEDHGRQLERLMTATPTSVSFSSAGGRLPGYNFLHADTVKCHNGCKRHISIDIGFKQTERTIFLHVISMG